MSAMIVKTRKASAMAADDATLFAAVDASPKVIRTVSINKSPALLSVPAPSAEHLERAAVIAQAPEFRARVAQALASRFPEDPAAPTPPVEKQIFGGFYSHADKTLLAEFQRADWRRRQEIVASLSDARLRQLGRRLVAFYAPELLSPEGRAQYKTWLQGRWAAAASPEAEWMTIERSRRALTEVQASEACDAALALEMDAFLGRFRLNLEP